MNFLLYDNPKEITKEQLQEMLSTLPSWRREQAMYFRFHIDQALCAKAYLLLREGLKQYYQIEGLPDFAYREHGKPYLKGYPHIHFNLSHCKKGILCVIDQQEIGCDIEEIPSEIDESLCNLCLSEMEKNKIRQSQNPCVDFTRLWTMKESYLKYKGEGLIDDLPRVLSSKVLACYEFDLRVEEKKGYVFCICKPKSGKNAEHNEEPKTV